MTERRPTSPPRAVKHTPPPRALRRLRVIVRGAVQGVGFRPFVYGLAVKHSLSGWVYNTSEDVRIEVEGQAEAIRQFEWELKTKAPPLAHIESITVEYHRPCGYKTLRFGRARLRRGSINSFLQMSLPVNLAWRVAES
jgi:acylphosphatase